MNNKRPSFINMVVTKTRYKKYTKERPKGAKKKLMN